MKYWIVIGNRENAAILLKKNIWGVPKRGRKKVSKLRIGDKMLLYVGQQLSSGKRQPPSILGLFEIVTKGYEDTSNIFATPRKRIDEKFPFRFHVKPLKVFTNPKDFRELVPKLSFIKNKKFWVGHLRGKSLIELSEEDFQIILKDHV